MIVVIKYGYYEYLFVWVLKNYFLYLLDKIDSFFYRVINYFVLFLSGVFVEVFYKLGIFCSFIVMEIFLLFSCFEG